LPSRNNNTSDLNESVNSLSKNKGDGRHDWLERTKNNNNITRKRPSNETTIVEKQIHNNKNEINILFNQTNNDVLIYSLPENDNFESTKKNLQNDLNNNDITVK
jgi:hypothetical protein